MNNMTTWSFFWTAQTARNTNGSDMEAWRLLLYF